MTASHYIRHRRRAARTDAIRGLAVKLGWALVIVTVYGSGMALVSWLAFSPFLGVAAP